MWQFWLIVAGIFLVAEMATVGFLVFWFSIGALLALITSLFTDNIIIQTTVFVISSGVLIFFTRPFVNKFAKSENKKETNAFSIIGKTALVTEEINPLLGTGQIKIEGEVWSAKTINSSIVPVDSQVEITAIEGVKAVIKPIKIPTTN